MLSKLSYLILFASRGSILFFENTHIKNIYVMLWDFIYIGIIFLNCNFILKIL